MSFPGATPGSCVTPRTRSSPPSRNTPARSTVWTPCRPSWSRQFAGPSNPPLSDGTRSDWPTLLRSAVTGHGLRAVYQPIVDLARAVVVGYEALIRFVDYPVANPEHWFAAAREHGLGAELQAAALRAALTNRAALPRNCFLTVNIGPEVLAHPA